MTSGRPLRFLAAVLGGWTALRAVALWPIVNPVAVLTGIAAASAAPGMSERPGAAPIEQTIPIASAEEVPIVPAQTVAPATGVAEARASDPAAPRPPAPSATGVLAPASEISSLPPPVAPAPLASPPRRLAVSAWLIARGGAGGTLLGGQLGASQAGVRATYTLDRRHRVALAARFATPLHGMGRELALGVDWQPLRLPLHVIAEQRIALDGGRGGPTLGAIGGIGPKPVVRGVQLEAYGQAGVIARDRGELFADGAVRLTHPVTLGRRLRLDLGISGWGGAQRGASRLDLGPTIGVVVPVAGRSLRLAADWRQRVAGDARPGSGPALSIGTDF